MPLTKAKKAEQIDKLAQELKGSTTAIVGTFAKLTVSQDFQLRKAVRGAGGSYRVLKNKLAARASQGSGVEAALQGLKGVSSVAYTSGDPVALAKALSSLGQGQRGIHLQARHRRRQGAQRRPDHRAGDHAGQGRDLTPSCCSSSTLRRSVWSPCINAAGRDLAVVINQGVEKGKFAAPAAAPVASTEALWSKRSTSCRAQRLPRLSQRCS